MIRVVAGKNLITMTLVTLESVRVNDLGLAIVIPSTEDAVEVQQNIVVGVMTELEVENDV